MTGTRDGKIARRVAQALLLFERVIVFLIDDDQAGVRQRRENGGSCADEQLGVAGTRLSPGRQALDVAESRVHERRLDTEPLAKAANHLWRQPDFRHEHKYLLVRLERVFNKAQVDLGLATAGHAVK